MNDQDLRQMRSEYVHDLAEALRATKAREASERSQTTAWVKDHAWTHKASDDFQGCVE